ncbi:MAG: nucleoside phosphorylase [Lachnospiraceae bacterium]|nr:nucleoside phosphorylase [Lachnospiraceae bacterium]
MNRNDSITDPQKLVRMEMKHKGFDIDKIKIPEKVYLLTDDIYDEMISKTKNIATKKYPLGGYLYVFNGHNNVGFIKGNMCSPAIATQAEDLIAGGVKELIHVGYAGGLQLDMKPGDIVITDGAYNDTAVARLYGYDFDRIASSVVLTDRVEARLKENELTYRRGIHWTTDAGYRETYGQILNYRKKGALCVEMEGVGLFTIANYRNCLATGIYIISDVLASEWKLGWDGKEINKSVGCIIEMIIGQMS